MAACGNWQAELENTLRTAGLNNLLNDFRACHNDTARIQFAIRHNLMSNVEWIQTLFDNCHKLTGKSLERATQYRLDGNKAFQKRLYKNALIKYTEAVITAPKSSSELAMAYGNRSAVLFQTNRYTESLVDIDQALACGFPQTTRHKLYIRQSRCLLKLGQTTKALFSIDNLEQLLEANVYEEKKRGELQAEIKKMTNDAKHQIGSESSIGMAAQEQVADVSYGRNDVLVQASSAVTMEITEAKGRYLIANQDIVAGDTLIVEKPYAAILLPDHYSTHCHHCIGQVDVAFPCRQCAHVRFCSAQCESVSWLQYHHVECLYLRLLHSVGIAHLSLRIILVAGLNYLKGFKEKCAGDVSEHGDCVSGHSGGVTGRVGGMDDKGQYSCSYQTVYDLMTHSDDLEPEDFIQYTLTAELLLRILRHSNWFHECDNTTDAATYESSNTDTVPSEPSESSNTDHVPSQHFKHCVTIQDSGSEDTDISRDTRVRDRAQTTSGIQETGPQSANCDDEMSVLSDTKLYIGNLLLRHIQQLVCNAHAITKLQCTQVEGSSWMEETSQTRVATAIYPTASLMNHSCDPTIISSFHRDMLVVKAVKNVKTGEEVFNCYGPHHKRMDWTERQHYLKQQYFFTCQCRPCVDGRQSEALIYSYRCESCDGPVTVEGDRYTCRDCQRKQDSVDPDQVNRCNALFQNGYQQLQQNNISSALACLEKCYAYRKHVLYKHNKLLSEVQDCLARCHATAGNFVKATEYLEASLETVEVIYGQESIEVANELQKLSELLISAHKWMKAVSVVTRAIQIFTMHYGDSHEAVQELSAAKRQLLDIL